MGLTDFSIKRVVMIDDSFIKESSSVKDIPEEVIALAPFTNELREFMDDEDETKTLKDFFEEEGISEFQKDFFFENINKYYKYFDDTFKGVILDKYLPGEFNQEKLKELEIIEESILFIVDKKLADRNYQSILREILEKISKLIKKKNNCFLFIYTSEVEKIGNYEELNKFLDTELRLSRESIEIISLHVNFVKKQSDLDDSVVNTAIRKSQKAKYLYSFSTIQKNTMDSMNRRIWEINNNELLIHYNYLSEGQHVDEILFDIYQTKFLQVYEEFYNENFFQKLKPLRTAVHSYISNISDLKYYTVHSRIIKELNREFGRTDTLKYKHLSNDISYGDVFQIKDKFFIVCSQQCDITIRVDGKRTNEDVTLLEIKKCTKHVNASVICEVIDNIINGKVKSKDKKSVIESLINIEEFKDLIKDPNILQEISNYYTKENYTLKNENVRSSYEYFEYKNRPKYYKIPAFILDSTLLENSDGVIEVTEDTINPYMDLRYSTKCAINEGLKAFRKKTTDLLTKQVAKEALGDVMLPNVDLDAEFVVNGGNLYGIKLRNISRIGHLSEEITSEIHNTYIKQITRVAKNEAPIF